MIAHLGMYDLPELQGAHDRFWHAIRAALGQGPSHLTRGGNFWDIWQSPELLLSQTCGYPYRARLHGQVQLVGTPDYDLSGCPPGYYNSVFLTSHKNRDLALASFDGAHFAFNEPLSQSGWAAPMQHMLGLGIAPGRLTQTGSHLDSATMVARGDADFAAIDAVTFLLLGATDPDFIAQLHTLDRTEPTPGLPYITASNSDADQLRVAIRTAITGLSSDDAHDLRLKGLVDIPSTAYLAVPNPAAPEDIAPVTYR
jgi:ABC-type phosphate/phosphonate transport system substrate-binding protein